MSLRDHLPGAGKRRETEAPREFYRSSHCELRGCQCQGRGKPDVAIQDQNKQPIGYVCQKGYHDHITSRGLDQFSTFKQTGEPLNPAKQASIEAKGIHRFADIVSDLDRYADSYDQGEQHEI